jgi:predicted NBD/HSP70 family sugar kinase
MTADHQVHTGRRAQPPEIVAAAATGDAGARATLSRYERRLARGLASVINILDPAVIVLGGGLSNIDRLYKNVPRLWTPYVFGAVRPVPARSPRSPRPRSGSTERVRTRLVRARHGDSSGVRGAAWLWGVE